MPGYIAFMRAINVGGRFIKMAALADHFRALGYSDVETFINSGNVIFTARARSAAKVEASAESGIRPLLGFTSELFVRTPRDVAAISERARAIANAHPEAQEVNVLLLKTSLSPAQQGDLLALRSDVDEFSLEGREVYWRCRVKQSESRFTNAVFERRLRIKATARRISMLEKLVGRLQG